jgi:hypothetical protein
MEGITQSYNMMDSVAFKKSKFIARIMKNNNDEYNLMEKEGKTHKSI